MSRTRLLYPRGGFLGQHDSNLDLTAGSLTVGLHPEKDDRVVVSFDGHHGSVTLEEWRDLVVAALAHDDSDPAKGARALLDACGVEVTDVHLEAIEAGLAVLFGAASGDVRVAWHWGDHKIDAAADVDTDVLWACVQYPAPVSGGKVASALDVLLVPPRAALRLGQQLQSLLA